MKPGTPLLQSARLLDQVRERVRYLHYSLKTEKAYLYWIRFFIRWCATQSGVMRHPRDLGVIEVEAFLSMLANERKVSASTHNQALSALLFLYREVLVIDLPWLNNIGRPQQTKRIPSVLTKDEVAGLLAQLDGVAALLARLLYGTGMRLMEGMRLRVKDVDFDRHVIIVREAKGSQDRVVMLPRSLVPAMRQQMLAARAQWEADRQAHHAGVEVPHALQAKYPNVGATWGWFWLFPSPTLSIDPRSSVQRRHHTRRIFRSIRHCQVSTSRALIATITIATSDCPICARATFHTKPDTTRSQYPGASIPHAVQFGVFCVGAAGQVSHRCGRGERSEAG
jgi:integron integrase